MATRWSFSASIGSPATTCARRWRALPPGTCPRRSTRARRSRGSRAWRLTSTRWTRSSSIASTTRSRRRPPMPRRRRRTSRRWRAIGDYVLWRRDGATPRSRIVEPSGAPGALSACGADTRSSRRSATASVFETTPVVVERSDWNLPKQVETAAAGQDTAFLAPGKATVALDLPEAGEYELSLQYHSQAPLQIVVGGEVIAELAPSLDGMYIDGAGGSAFWPAGELTADGAGSGRGRASRQAPERPSAGARRRAPRLARRDRRDLERRSGESRAARRLRRLRRPLPLPARRSRGRLMAKDLGTPDELPSPVYGGGEIERAPELAKLVFIGGTGRSGTHVLSRLLSRHDRFGLVPVEVRFHTDADGFPGLLAGEVTPRAVRQAPARLLVEGLSDQPHARHVSLRRRGSLRGGRRALRARARRRSRGRLSQSLLRPAVVSRRRGREGGRGRGADRAEHRLGGAGGDPGPAVSRGALHPRRSRRSRRFGVEGLADARAGAPAHAPAGDRVVGGADRGDRGRRGSDPARAAAHGQPRRARAPAARARRVATDVPIPRRAGDQAHSPLLQQAHDHRRLERRALARGDLGAKGRPHQRHVRARRSVASRPPVRAARRCFATRSSAVPTSSTRWSMSTIEALHELGHRHPRRPRGPGRPRLRRRHRAQRHAHPQLPARQALALSRRSDRVPLSLQPEGALGSRHGPHRRRRLPHQAQGLLVAPGADRRSRLRSRQVAGDGPRARPRLAPDHRARALLRSGSALRGEPRATICSMPRAPSSTTCCSRWPTRRESRSWSR